MLIYPAIDVIDGRCVRLLRGSFDAATLYGDPVEQALAFAREGAEWIHIVDLDGARDGERRQTALIARIAAECGAKVQCGGGVRRGADIDALLEAGVARVVVGSAAINAPETVLEWIDAFGAEKICAAFDARTDTGGIFRVATNGWRSDAGVSIDDALAAFAPGSLAHVLVTDISRDGALEGANAALVAHICALRPEISVQASGGVATLADLEQLNETGAAGVIIGRALYEGRFTLEAALGR